METTLVKDYKAELAKYDFAENFGDYSSGYICDIITEIADNEVSIYTQKQIDFAMSHDDEVSEALANGIACDGASWFSENGNDLRGYIAHVGAAAWYEYNNQTIYENMEECVLYAVLTALEDQHGITELSEDQVTELEALEFDNNDDLEDVIVEAAEVLGLVDDDEDEDEE